MESVTMKRLTELVLAQAKAKGFGTTPEELNVPEKFAQIHSEVSEAYEAYRRKNIEGKDGVTEELGDVLQRVLHLCGALGLDVEEAVLEKLEYNRGRTWEWEKMNETHA